MRFLVIARFPSRQGFLGPVPEKYIVDELEAVDLDDVMSKVKTPLDGDCRIVDISFVTTVKSRIINEVVR